MCYRVARVTVAAGFRIACKGGQGGSKETSQEPKTSSDLKGSNCSSILKVKVIGLPERLDMEL